MIFYPSCCFFIPQFFLQLLVIHNYLFNFPQISHLSLILYFYIFSHITLFFYKITITNIFHFYCNSRLIQLILQSFFFDLVSFSTFYSFFLCFSSFLLYILMAFMLLFVFYVSFLLVALLLLCVGNSPVETVDNFVNNFKQSFSIHELFTIVFGLHNIVFYFLFIVLIMCTNLKPFLPLCFWLYIIHCNSVQVLSKKIAV